MRKARAYCPLVLPRRPVRCEKRLLLPSSSSFTIDTDVDDDDAVNEWFLMVGEVSSPLPLPPRTVAVASLTISNRRTRRSPTTTGSNFILRILAFCFVHRILWILCERKNFATRIVCVLVRVLFESAWHGYIPFVEGASQRPTKMKGETRDRQQSITCIIVG